MRKAVDLRLYALIDPEQSGGHDLANLADWLVAGGVTLIQIRDKLGSTRTAIKRARAILHAVAHRVPVVINDRVDIALATGADGVHLGQDDMAPEDARRLLGEAAIIGLTIKTEAQAGAAPLEVADYCCIGGVFTTSSKNNPDPPIGLNGLRHVSSVLRARNPAHPVGAIAGITLANVADVIAAGADGVAVISALSRTGDPQRAAREFREIIDGAIKRRPA